MLKRVFVVAVLLLFAPLASGHFIQFQTTGLTFPSDCTPPLPPQPLCVVVHADGTLVALAGDVPGSWHYVADGQGLFGVGGGTWSLDDLGPGNNDLFGTFTIQFTPPDAGGIIVATIDYLVTGGMGIFAGLTGAGSSVDLINGYPPSNPLGAFVETGFLAVPEPPTVALLVVGATILGFARRRSGPR